MIDYDKLADKLTDGFIHREYQMLNPQLSDDYHGKAIMKYRTDSVFHARVSSLVAGVIGIVRLSESEDEPPMLPTNQEPRL